MWVGLRQNAHDIRMDREEMGKAIAVDEYGLTQAGGAGAAATRTYGWSQFQMRMATSSAPNIPYSNLSVESGKYSRVFINAPSYLPGKQSRPELGSRSASIECCI